jgi:hypothetical protein
LTKTIIGKLIEYKMPSYKMTVDKNIGRMIEDKMPLYKMTVDKNDFWQND